MAYRTDKDLEFLSKISSKEMMPLVELITKEKNQNLDKRDPHDPAYWTYIAEQIQLYGGNTFINIFRLGDGVLYREILEDICNKFEVKYKKSDLVSEIEDRLIKKSFFVAWEKLDPAQKRKILASVNIPFVPGILQENGWSIVNSILEKKSFASNKLLQNFSYGIAFSFLGKPSNAFDLGRGIERWIISPNILLAGTYVLSGPAYRVTVPACLILANLRKQVEQTLEENLAQEKRNKTNAEILKIIRKLIEEEKKIIHLYVYCHKILELKKVEDMYKDILHEKIFGTTSIEERNKNTIEKLLHQETFSSVIKKNIDVGNTEEDLRKLLDYWIEIIDEMPEGIIAIGPSGSASNQTIVSEFNKTVAEL